MSKLRNHLIEAVNRQLTRPDDIANEIEGMFDTMLFQLDTIIDMKAIDHNVKKKIGRITSDMRKLKFEITDNIRS